MKVELRFAGIGGQGIIMQGNVFARALAIYEDINTVQTIAYSAAKRGGLTWTDIIASDNEIYDLSVHEPDYLVITANKAFIANRRYFDTIRFAVLDSHHVKVNLKNYEKKVYSADFENMCREYGLNSRSTNMIIVGIIARVAGLVSLESLKKAVRDISKTSVDDNIRALEFGFKKIII